MFPSPCSLTARGALIGWSAVLETDWGLDTATGSLRLWDPVQRRWYLAVQEAGTAHEREAARANQEATRARQAEAEIARLQVLLHRQGHAPKTPWTDINPEFPGPYGLITDPVASETTGSSVGGQGNRGLAGCRRLASVRRQGHASVAHRIGINGDSGRFPVGVDVARGVRPRGAPRHGLPAVPIVPGGIHAFRMSGVVCGAVDRPLHLCHASARSAMCSRRSDLALCRPWLCRMCVTLTGLVRAIGHILDLPAATGLPG